VNVRPDAGPGTYGAPVRLVRRAADTVVLDLLEESGRNLQRGSGLLRELLTDYPEHADLARALKECEHEGDRITHDVILRLSRRNGLRPPFDASDGHALATALDDVVDYAEQAADWLGLYGVEGPMDQAIQMADVLVLAADQVALALGALRSGADLVPFLVEINRLENEGDRIQRDAVASLFANGIDPMVVIRWKDIFDCLESAVDATESVAHIVEGIEIKRGG
jgi:predicted phosphate transport protein (TIGR00153 family)